ncbi:hypothetical protein [Halorarius halobius]|uniref:hypothetical protein n=1 Tax=Halorarius halobius TaxID=2962671 RepID=UPI0020CED935|nr:hypothetical protein [Halorarius halobius]
MEQGTDRECAAVRREWRALERERRLTTRLLAGVALVFGGVVAALVFAGLPLEACVYTYGLRADSCSTTAVSAAGRVALAAVAAAALVGGAWLAAGSARRLRAGRHPR